MGRRRRRRLVRGQVARQKALLDAMGEDAGV